MSNKKSQISELFVITAPSGTGKTTILRRVLKSEKNLWYSVSATTRARRVGEKDGKDYFFLSEEEFLNRIKRKEFLEFARVYRNYYGTLKKPFFSALKNKRDVIMDLDIQGARRIKKIFPHATLIFIAPPDFNELRSRLILRKAVKNPCQSLAERRQEEKIRLGAYKKEIATISNFDYLIVNKELKKAVQELRTIIAAQRLKIRTFSKPRPIAHNRAQVHSAQVRKSIVHKPCAPVSYALL